MNLAQFIGPEVAYRFKRLMRRSHFVIPAPVFTEVRVEPSQIDGRVGRYTRFNQAIELFKQHGDMTVKELADRMGVGVDQAGTVVRRLYLHHKLRLVSDMRPMTWGLR
jgi:hypothetical protein